MTRFEKLLLLLLVTVFKFVIHQYATGRVFGYIDFIDTFTKEIQDA